MPETNAQRFQRYKQLARNHPDWDADKLREELVSRGEHPHDVDRLLPTALRELRNAEEWTDPKIRAE